jgi:16S rRNA (cytosine967-C5)-methyltransferase
MTKEKKGVYDGRRLALETLIRVEQDRAYANRVLHALFLRLDPTPENRAQATALVYGSLRHITRIDHLLSQMITKKPIMSLTPAIRNLLRLSIYELDFTDTPSYAVVNTSVRMAKLYGHEGVARLVNGVLRNYQRTKIELSLPSFSQDPIEHLIVSHSHPRWLIESWLHQWDAQRVHQLVRINNGPAPLSMRVNTLRTNRDKLLAELNKDEVITEVSQILPEALRLFRATSLDHLPVLMHGDALIQDIGSMMITHLMAPQPGQQIVDLCAAPGGKTTHMAQLMKNKGYIWAIDQYVERTNRIIESAQRMGIEIINVQTADARSWQPPHLVDGVLLDAPCTGTGVIRRRPDLRWRRQLKDLDELVALQEELLTAAASMLKPGGRLVYSTCSIQNQENEEQIVEFLKTHSNFRRLEDPVEFRQLLAHPDLDVILSSNGYLLMPTEHNDGFFMSCLTRIE